MNPMQSPNVGPGGADFGKRERFSVEPEPDQFRADDVWENSRGTPHRVLTVKNGKARLLNLRTGKAISKECGDLGWRAGKPWVRLSCGF